MIPEAFQQQRRIGTTPDETVDSVRGGALVLRQHRDGYRTTQDALLLASFAIAESPADLPLRAIDLGTGCGVVALALAQARPGWQVAGLELQAGLARLARENATENRLPVTVHEGDWKAARLAVPTDAWDLVTCNPPYFTLGDGKTCADDERAIARQETHGAIENAAAAARRLLSGTGRAAFVYPAAGLGRALAALAAARLTPTRLRTVHHTATEAASVVLVEGRANTRRAMAIEAPLVLREPGGAWTGEARLIFG